MRRVLVWIGLILVSLVVVVAVIAAIVVVDTNRDVAANVTPLPPPTVLGRASLDRGRHLFATVAGCGECHRPDAGGGPFIKDPMMAILNATNLTRGPGGVGTLYSDGDYDRAMRRGVRPDGTRLLIMPSWDYAALTDDDAASIIAYVRSLPPVDRATPRIKLGPVARVLLATHKLEFDATRLAEEGVPPTTPVPAAPTADYGKYLARIGGCMSCHGVNLSGGHFQGPPDVPAAANLTPTGIGSWSQADFARTMRTGKDPSGHVLDPFMPWRAFASMTNYELTALYEYLRTVPPRPTGTG